jgi:hypothetical protein
MIAQREEFRMRVDLATALLVSVVTVLGVPEAAAHHSFMIEFDPDTEAEIEGTISKVWFTNPHIRYSVTVESANGSTEEWLLQPPGNIPNLRTAGWHEDTLQVGDFITASGNLGRGGASKIYLLCAEKDDGTLVGRCAPSGGRQAVSNDPDKDYGFSSNAYDVDITGYWSSRYRFTTTVDDFEPKPMPLTAEARAIYEGRRLGDDEGLKCMAVGLPRIFGSPYPIEIVDAGTHYLMLSLHDNTPRWVYMDGRSVPEDYPLSRMGFSVGRWEDRTLVIESTRLSPVWADTSGYPLSGGDDTRIVERWTLAEDGLTIDRTMTIHDPLYTAPITRTRGSQRDDTLSSVIESPACDPDSHYRDLVEGGQLEERLFN